ncbi:hypothetical protein A3I18_01035 [Candidatus Campbellbacteria bacterium RIFCSPLOWO2_02_FULL_35_11]|uniref:Uncharacterized protein n=2 Tax=Candidatus Campbelliibacteriota TaxID=1752727 RepID=A0A1F5EKZ9_9BACT|nr:MAG: hypothetical protein A3E89_02275 [Candidatus Campbellbacteria bacterium RIFCSPHIGHO2_12_FULL_35_10]OGD69689.1 MAG: hypothetical protein A3I18_01035 [Candidatus Campbellbacteria bacterium RIFCSPLOWO2_02_FULL_35_11]
MTETGKSSLDGVWKEWHRMNCSGGLMPEELMRERFRHGGESAVNAITCPPDRTWGKWFTEKEDFILSKPYGTNGWKNGGFGRRQYR